MASPENNTRDINYNNKLSTARANSVKQELLKRGVDPGQITSVKGTGTKRVEEKGVIPGSSEGEKSKFRGANTRTEVKRNPQYD